jgi:uncharacterized protein YndB with AHSA1/START domain
MCTTSCDLFPTPPPMTKITVETTVNVPVADAWKAWTEPEAIMKWCSGHPDWHTPRAENDLREGGTFVTRMEAKDGSMGFDFGGTYTTVVPNERIEYVMDDKREVQIAFEDQGDKTHIVETFDAETQNSVEMQRAGWQGIMDNFKTYAEGQKA